MIGATGGAADLDAAWADIRRFLLPIMPNHGDQSESETLESVVLPGVSVQYGLVFDDAILAAKVSKLEDWGVSLPEVEQVALSNLRQVVRDALPARTRFILFGELTVRVVVDRPTWPSVLFLAPDLLIEVFDADAGYFVAPLPSVAMLWPPDSTRAEIAETCGWLQHKTGESLVAPIIAVRPA